MVDNASLARTLLSFTTYRSVGRITGAGVLPLETCERETCVMLFHNERRRTYEDAGGWLEPHETIADGAAREFREESCNMFRLDGSALSTYHDVDGRYRAYVVRLTGDAVSSERYYHNLSRLRENEAPSNWLETDGVGRFSVSQLLADGLLTHRGRLATRQTDGTRAEIFERTVDALRKLYVRTHEFRHVHPVSATLGAPVESPGAWKHSLTCSFDCAEERASMTDSGDSDLVGKHALAISSNARRTLLSFEMPQI